MRGYDAFHAEPGELRDIGEVVAVVHGIYDHQSGVSDLRRRQFQLHEPRADGAGCRCGLAHHHDRFCGGKYVHLTRKR
ncbi:hypothetical protein D3C73_1357070 [compost metagenome]